MKAETPLRLVVLLLILAVLSFFAGQAFYPSAQKSCPVNLFGKTSSPGTAPALSQVPANFQITDAKMAVGLDDQLKPVQPTDVFQRDTRRVFCWFSWENATPKMEMKANWSYAIDNVHILTYDFRIPREKGSGGLSLIMPTGKVFPVGAYRLDLVTGNRTLKTLTFKVK